MKVFKYLALVCILCSLAFSQSHVAGDRVWLGITDSSGATHTYPFRTAVSLPGSCTNNEWVAIPGASNTMTVYFCSSNAWQPYISGGGGGGSMVYPGAGIPVSTGTAWTTSKTTPTGTIVGTTDTQTLTNKTVDGVSPAIMANMDATSSIQTQLNTKISNLAIQQSGSSIGSATTLNCSTNVTCSIASGVVSVSASGAGGGSGLTSFMGRTTAAAVLQDADVYTAFGFTKGGGSTFELLNGSFTLGHVPAFNSAGILVDSGFAASSIGSGGVAGPFGYYMAVASGSGTQTIGTDCSPSTPCSTRIGTSTTKVTSAASFTVPSGAGSNDTAYIYIDPSNKQLTVGTQTITTTCTGCTSTTGVTNFPVGSVPLYVATITSGNVATLVDNRAPYASPLPFSAGTCIILTPGSTSEQISLDSSNPSCVGSGGTGTTFTGGNITNPLTITTAGGTPPMNLALNSSSGYMFYAVTDDLGHQWQIGTGGSTSSQSGVFYMYDGNTSNSFFSVDNFDQMHFTSTSSGQIPMQVSSASTSGTSLEVTNLSSGGHAWLIGSLGSGQAHTGAFQWFDVTSNLVGMRINTTIGTTIFDNVQLGAANGGYTPPTCNTAAAGTFAWDNGTSPKKPEVCDGSAYHHLTYAD